VSSILWSSYAVFEAAQLFASHFANQSVVSASAGRNGRRGDRFSVTLEAMSSGTERPVHPSVGMCFHRSYPAAFITEVAKRLDGGADQLWVIEDCFYTAGVSLAAAALAVTERVQVGIGILPAVARNAAITAMEIATLCGLAPGRVLPGIGHGVQDWMAQMGARPPSPVTTLEEVIVAVRRLIAGERVTSRGRYVHLDDVQLEQPPAEPPPVLAGVRGKVSLAMAGRVADGIVLAEPAAPSYVRWSLQQAGHPDPFHVAVFAPLCIEPTRAAAYRTMAPWLAGLLAHPHVGITVLPFFDELVALHARHGVDGLATMPASWWSEIGPFGTVDDAAAHLDALGATGVDSVGLFLAPDAAGARQQIDAVIALARH
jgi:alkanesulfonate monooxygenase SsuD/methylene tetrahydromethanopterin reductase-like flavin-dependent oxidoreductase (luciferase family)